jgi:DNA-directed RNA polymerase specialized sigma24 family protein
LEEIEKIIRRTTWETVQRLRAEGLLREPLSVGRKTEELLKHYSLLLESDSDTVQTLINRLRTALDALQDDLYYEVISMAYIENMSVWEISEYFGTSDRTIKRHKKRLLNEIGKRVFTEDWVKEVIG